MSTETKERGPYSGGWFDKRNKRRRDEYHSDPEYREKATREARESYRQSKGKQQPFDPRINLPRLKSMGTSRKLRDGGSEPQLTFTKAELGEVFERPTKQIQQWAADGRIPPTVEKARAENERNWFDVYTLEEVTVMVNALGPFLAELIYYRNDHVDAIKAVYGAVEAVR